MTSSNKKEETLTCACFNEIVKLEKWPDEDEVYFTLFQHEPKKVSFKKRLKIAWGFMRGNRVETFDLVFTEEEWSKIKKF